MIRGITGRAALARGQLGAGGCKLPRCSVTDMAALRPHSGRSVCAAAAWERKWKPNRKVRSMRLFVAEQIDVDPMARELIVKGLSRKFELGDCR